MTEMHNGKSFRGAILIVCSVILGIYIALGLYSIFGGQSETNSPKPIRVHHVCELEQKLNNIDRQLDCVKNSIEFHYVHPLVLIETQVCRHDSAIGAPACCMSGGYNRKWGV